MTSEWVSLFDVDNTLLDNDGVKADLAAQIRLLVGDEYGAQFWLCYEAVRQELGYVDYLQTLARYGATFPRERGFGALADRILTYPYAQALFPGALATLAHAQTFGPVAILSDGDPVFQPAKIARAGLAAAVDGQVFVYDHKEPHLHEVMAQLPARRYLLVDDKLQILATVKQMFGAHVVTVLVRQGKYAQTQVEQVGAEPDRSVAHIADVCDLSLEIP